MDRNPRLEQLDPLIGHWEMRSDMGEAWTRLDWHPSGAFLVQYTDLEGRESLPPEVRTDLPMPSTIIVGLDEGSDELHALFSDARGVLRVYRWSVADRVWRMWRAAPGFHQRFEGRIGADGRMIEAAWEKSRDGETWEHDFDLTYTKSV